ncbi:Transforming growth factor-beta-induced protein ig-h3 [Armadillidium nasatum]|uniref:Transforming growth factor-beta-induced protein ig-h3 n=1 Tax=Armadillidium nasatum TaxID=96803 RepID=A0A5N5SY67_9CRUS|nr:Transforming growth factor-beta-induced protein ig-h3 [Armadillidium nasatum]
MSSCRDSRDKYTCINSSTRRGLHKTVKITYRCCHGFVRDGYGCTKIDIFSMPETLEKLEATSDFLSLIKAADLIDVLTSSNLTIFAPSNEAIAEYTADLEEKVNRMKYKTILMVFVTMFTEEKGKPTIWHQHSLSHMTNGFIYAGDFADEMIIPSINKKSTLRINMYSGYPPTVTVNCARIVTANQHSINGVVHTVDRVIKPVEKSIADIITSDPQFTIMKQLLSSSGMVEELRSDGQFTMFAPTDAAFKRLKPSILNSLLEGSSCLEAVIKQHILPNTICSDSIQGKMKTSSLLDQYLIVERTEDGKLFVEDSQIVAKDIVGTNGVLHIIDKPLIPNEGEIYFLENMYIPYVSFNQGFGSVESNPEKLREILRYHMTVPSIRANTLTNNQMADTAAGHPLRINLYAGAPLLTGIFRGNRGRPVRVTAGCSRVSVLDSRACGAVVHIIEDMLEVPKADILSALEEEKFSLFKRMIEESGRNWRKKGLILYSFHPTTPSELYLTKSSKDIMKNNELKDKIVRRHILKEHICCSGVNSNNWLFMDRKRTMDGSNIHIRRAHNGRLMAGPARIIDCGAPTSNGVVHTINRMIVDESDLVPSGGRNGPEGGKIFPLSNFGKIFVF